MSTLEEIGQERQKLSERLARLDAERSRLAEQLNELDVAERVLMRFSTPEGRPRRRPGRPPRAAAAPAPQRPAARRRGRAAAAPTGQPSVSDAVLNTVRAHPEGLTADDVAKRLSSEFGLTVRPNHLGIALQRHRRAGRLEQRDQRWFPPRAEAGAAA
jgi:hypothetical protein